MSLPINLQPGGLQASHYSLVQLLEVANLGFTLAAPVPAVTAVGTASGATAYSYTVTCWSALGTTSTVSATVSVNNVATLSAAAYNRINWSPVPGPVVGYTVNRTVGGPSQGVIAVVAAGNVLSCFPPGALVSPSFPLMPAFELHDTGLGVVVP
jgi:hypothetical protein